MGGGYADAVNSGTNACYISVKSLELKKLKNRDIIIYRSWSLQRCAISRYKPIPLPFVSEKDCQIDINQLYKVISSNDIKAIIVVHTFGIAENIEQICRFCEQADIPIVEDISQAQGATFGGKILEASVIYHFFRLWEENLLFQALRERWYIQKIRN